MQITEGHPAGNLKQTIKKAVKSKLPVKKPKSETNDGIDSSSLLKAIDEGMLTESIEKIVFIKKLMSRIQ